MLTDKLRGYAHDISSISTILFELTHSFDNFSVYPIDDGRCFQINRRTSNGPEIPKYPTDILFILQEHVVSIMH